MINYANEQTIALLISSGDTTQWARCLLEVKKILSSWTITPAVDPELEIIEAIWKASKSYQPRKMRFVSWAAFVANRKIIDKFRSFSNRSKFWNQSTEVNHEFEYKRDRHQVDPIPEEEMEESICQL